jgi:DNA-binding LacI/PurR family transcriptional regulator
MDSRHLIALITNDLVGTYQYSFWAGMKIAALTDDCDLVSFNGGALDSPDPSKSRRNVCFDLLPPAKPDAVVILASIFNDIADQESVRSFLARFGSTPMVTVGFEVEGYRSLLVDNKTGMRALVEHLIEAHGRSRFCFVGGSPANPDSMERRQALIEVLARHDLSLRQETDLVGHFDFGIARDQVLALVDAGHSFDAVVAANDIMALGAMEALRERGKRIPDDVIVTGFDNIEDGLWVPPALTTVEQPVQEQGEAAVHMLLDILEGSRRIDPVRMASTPVFRGSCGCGSPSMVAAHVGYPDLGEQGHVAGRFNGSAHLEAVLGECEPVLSSKRFSSHIKDLLGAIGSDCSDGGHASTQQRFEFLVEMASTPGEGLDRWQILLSGLRGASLPFLPLDHRIRAAFDGLVHGLRVWVHERSLQQLGLANLQTQRWAREVHEVGIRLTGCPEVEQVMDILAAEAKSLKISALHMYLRDSDPAREVHRLHLALHSGGLEPLPGDGLEMSPKDLFHRMVRSRPLRSAVVVEPLFFGEIQLGFAFLELVSRRGMLLDSLRGLISAALIGTRLGETLSEFPGISGIPNEDWLENPPPAPR